MNFLSVVILSVVVFAVMLATARRAGGILQFPFLMTAVIAGWFLPQAYVLLDQGGYPSFGYLTTMFYVASCILTAYVFDRLGNRKFIPVNIKFDTQRMLLGATFLSIIGAVSYALIIATPRSTTADGLTTGVVTIYFFFFTAQYFGLAASLLIFLRKFSLWALAIVAFNYATLGGFVLVGGRRGPLVALVLITLCALWFQRRVVPPRALVLVGIVVASIFFNAIGDYRRLVTSVNSDLQYQDEARLPTFSEIMEINFIERFFSDNPRRTDEVRNAIYNVSAATVTADFHLGREYWNHFIFSYVPGQIVGHRVKRAIQFPSNDPAQALYGYRSHIGTTSTGFSDSYSGFFIFGVFVFGLIAYFMRRLWIFAMAGSIRAQYFYCILIATALHGITHSTAWFIAALPQAIIFSWAIFPVSKSPPALRSTLRGQVFRRLFA